jgi:hypothetical protein
MTQSELKGSLLTGHVEILQNPFHLLVNGHVSPLEAEVGQILGGPESSGKYEPGIISRDEVFERLNGGSGDPGRLGEHASGGFHRFTDLVVNHVSLK